MDCSSLALNHQRTFDAKRRKLPNDRSFQFNLDIDLDLGVSLLEDEENDENTDSDCGALDFSRTRDTFHFEPTPPSVPVATSAPPGPSKSKRQATHKNADPTADVNNKPFSLNCRPRQLADAADRFSRISDEVILEVFRWLPKTGLKNCALVSKRWKRLVYDESLWKRLNLSGRNLKPEVMGHILGRGVTMLRMAKTDIETPLGLYSSEQLVDDTSFCKLKVLDLTMSSISLLGLNELLSVCDKLRYLSLEHCKIDDETCSHLAKNNELRELNLAMCSGLSSAGLLQILKQCQKLTALNLSWTNLHKEAVIILAYNVPNFLERLNVSGCRDSLDDKHMEKLVRRCNRLKELDVSDAVHLTPRSLSAIVTYLGNIRTLSLSRCYSITPDSYELLQLLPSLTDFSVFGLFNPSGIQFLKGKFPNVTVNASPFSAVARPTTGSKRTSTWGFRIQD